VVLQHLLQDQAIGVDVEVLFWRAAYARVIFCIFLGGISKDMLGGMGKS
jgi:hypothetical protein